MSTASNAVLTWRCPNHRRTTITVTIPRGIQTIRQNRLDVLPLSQIVRTVFFSCNNPHCTISQVTEIPNTFSLEQTMQCESRLGSWFTTSNPLTFPDIFCDEDNVDNYYAVDIYTHELIMDTCDAKRFGIKATARTRNNQETVLDPVYKVNFYTRTPRQHPAGRAAPSPSSLRSTVSWAPPLRILDQGSPMTNATTPTTAPPDTPRSSRSGRSPNVHIWDDNTSDEYPLPDTE